MVAALPCVKKYPVVGNCPRSPLLNVKRRPRQRVLPLDPPFDHFGGRDDRVLLHELAQVHAGVGYSYLSNAILTKNDLVTTDDFPSRIPPVATFGDLSLGWTF